MWLSSGIRTAQDRPFASRKLRVRPKPYASNFNLWKCEVPTQIFESALKTATKGQVHGVIVAATPVYRTHKTRLLNLATKSRLPVVYDDREFVDAGGLMSYGPNHLDLYHRAAYYVDRILKGAKPADLPIEQPSKFKLVINLKTAKQIDLSIPPNVLARADKVIK
jgi:putative ABC transport system substrate-binding protein